MPKWDETMFQELVKRVLKMTEEERIEAILRDLNKVAVVVQVQQTVAEINVQNFREILRFMDDTNARMKAIEEKMSIVEVTQKEDGQKKTSRYTS